MSFNVLIIRNGLTMVHHSIVVLQSFHIVCFSISFTVVFCY